MFVDIVFERSGKVDSDTFTRISETDGWMKSFQREVPEHVA
jgi:hypothetical protein